MLTVACVFKSLCRHLSCLGYQQLSTTGECVSTIEFDELWIIETTIILYAHVRLGESTIDEILVEFQRHQVNNMNVVHSIRGVTQVTVSGTSRLYPNRTCTVIQANIEIEVPAVVGVQSWLTSDLQYFRNMPWTMDTNITSSTIQGSNHSHYEHITVHNAATVDATDCVLEEGENSTNMLAPLMNIGSPQIMTANYSQFARYPECAMIELSDDEFDRSPPNSTTLYLSQSLSSLVVSATSYVIAAGKVYICAHILQSANALMGGNHDDDWTAMTEHVLTYACMSVSCICLVLCMVTYCRFTELLTLRGKNTMNIVCSLFVAQMTFMCGAGMPDFPEACRVIGIILHAEWLCSCTWTLVATIHMVRVFRNPTLPDAHRFGQGTFAVYMFCGYGIPIILVAVSAAVDLLQWGPIRAQYGKTVCFISSPLAVAVLFATPVGMILIANIVMFVTIYCSIKTTITIPVDSTTAPKRSMVIIYARMSCLMGLTWVFGFVATFTGLNVFWIVFIVLNGLQGLFIFLATACTPRVTRLWHPTSIDAVESFSPAQT
jgi:G protein-coupled receptor Mth (Methuselah protein)